ncbi:hypothetical protein [Enterobacter sichuanensis]|uniref:hypothetical protein n=1 Tax=Enterobacter sichuanensis TaxID=2071710 RepID=UPI002A830000|nr:hypothetical protein [Enterobacter sichuanensis]
MSERTIEERIAYLEMVVSHATTRSDMLFLLVSAMLDGRVKNHEHAEQFLSHLTSDDPDVEETASSEREYLIGLLRRR